MISFIVIGRNEGWKLTKCFQSIFDTIKFNNLKDYEIIYVDSNSTDNSIDRAKQFPEIKIFKITGQCNAPIARNIGAKESIGDILCFLDGDMEINSNFLQLLFNKGKLNYPLVAGRALDRLINSKREIIKEVLYHQKEEVYDKVITGGAFIIKKELWIANCGMDNRFVRGADPEIGLRLAKKGILQKCLPYLFIIHNNDKYGTNKRRRIKSLMNLNHLYGSMLIYRKNINCKYTWYRFIKNEKSLIALILSLAPTIIFKNSLFLIIYILVLIMRSRKEKTITHFMESFTYYIIRDISVILGFFFFHPHNINTEEIRYERVGCND